MAFLKNLIGKKSAIFFVFFLFFYFVTKKSNMHCQNQATSTVSLNLLNILFYFVYSFKGWNLAIDIHCVKSVQIRSFSGPCFPLFGLNTEISREPYPPNLLALGIVIVEMFLVCQVFLQDHLIKWSCDFISWSPFWYLTTLLSLVAKAFWQ